MKSRKPIMVDKTPIYVVIGTRAQFIKMAPVLRGLADGNIPYTLLYTAQHSENIKEILKLYHLHSPDIVLHERAEANTKVRFLRWFFSIFFKVIFIGKQFISYPGILLTHGDTVTTWLGALLGKRTGCAVWHIESGFRSFNLISPFPEEICRLITFSLTDVYFCSDDLAIYNLHSYSGMKVNLGANTLLDGVRYALAQEKSQYFSFEDKPYALVSIHRYENIFKPRFLDVILPLLEEIAKDFQMVFTLHPTTRERLKNLGIYKRLDENPRIEMYGRFGFVDWIHLCNRAQFVITDGGSNQEELFYLGIPTILFRNETERKEGIGRNVILSKFDPIVIKHVLENLTQYRFEKNIFISEPTQTIVDMIRRKTL